MINPVRTLFTLLTIVICSLTAYSQEISSMTKKIHGHDEETGYWNLRKEFLTAEMKLGPLEGSAFPFHYRLWMDGQIIDVIMDSNDVYSGMLIQYIQDLHGTEESFTAKVYSESIPINESISKQLYDLINGSITAALARQEPLHGSVIDDIEIIYVMELSTNGAYFIKDYWDPLTYAYKGNDARLLLSFTDSVSNILDLDKKYEAFIADLQPGCYNTSTYILRCNISGPEMKMLTGRDPGNTKEEVLKYLNNQSWQYLSSDDDWIWHGYVDLSFGKNGKVKSVEFRTVGGYALESFWYSKRMQKLQSYVKKSIKKLYLAHLQPESDFETRVSLRYDSATDVLLWGEW